jgi:2-(1,2-epoxy-1,2-dihydrophenyl)acetyl-CoA isomerase
MTDADVLLSEWHEPGILMLTLNRPNVLNAISMELQDRLDEQFDIAAGDAAVRCILLTGAGDRAFSSGYDIRELSCMSMDDYALMQLRWGEWPWKIATLPCPVVAAINGVAHGMGAVLALGADIRIGSPSASFRITAAERGGVGLTWNLPLLVGWGHAKEMLLTARSVPAPEAAQIGLLNRVVDDHDLLPEALSVAQSIAQLPPAGVRETKRLIHEGVGDRLRSRFDAENSFMRQTFRGQPMTEVFEGVLDRRPSGEGTSR